jgi:hypothetical protein
MIPKEHSILECGGSRTGTRISFFQHTGGSKCLASLSHEGGKDHVPETFSFKVLEESKVQMLINPDGSSLLVKRVLCS